MRNQLTMIKVITKWKTSTKLSEQFQKSNLQFIETAKYLLWYKLYTFATRSQGIYLHLDILSVNLPEIPNRSVKIYFIYGFFAWISEFLYLCTFHQNCEYIGRPIYEKNSTNKKILS
jgi:hypothetical protein